MYKIKIKIHDCHVLLMTDRQGDSVPQVSQLTVVISGEDLSLCYSLNIDERKNTIKVMQNLDILRDNAGFPCFKRTTVFHKVTDEIIRFFNELKSSNPSYGTIGMGDDIEYDPVKNIFIGDFFKFLKSKKRDLLINKILYE